MNPQIPKTEGWREHLSGRQIEERIAVLQDANRLGIHRYEEEDRYSSFPGEMRAEMEKNRMYFGGADVKGMGLLDNADMPIISMSLMPKRSAIQPMKPYDLDLYGFSPSYLFDLHGPDPIEAPRVIKAFHGVSDTGRFNTKKNLILSYRSATPELDAIYAQYFESDWDELLKNEQTPIARAFLTHMFNHPELSGRQLDALAPHLGLRYNDYCNELLVAAAPQHIAAIAVTVGQESDPSWGIDKTYTDAGARLAGALSGLDHAERGEPLPVMLYHLTGTKKGTFEYFAQGKDACRAAALKAIDDIQGDPHFQARQFVTDPGSRECRRNAQTLLGVDILVPLRQQRIPGAGMGGVS